MKITAKSMYPSILIQNNISVNTQIGKIDIPEKVYDDENAYHNDKYVRSGEFIENMMTDNTIEFCKRWFGLAGIPEFLQDMKEYASNYKHGAPYQRFKYENGRVIENPIYDITPNSKEVKSNKPIYNLSNLNDNGMNSDYSKIMEGKVRKDGSD